MDFDLYPFTGGRRHLHKVRCFVFYPNRSDAPPLSRKRGNDFAAQLPWINPFIERHGVRRNPGSGLRLLQLLSFFRAGPGGLGPPNGLERGCFTCPEVY